MIWDLIDTLARIDKHEAAVKGGEIFIRESAQPTTDMPSVSLVGDFFDHPDCRIPVGTDLEPAE